jgi:hypothetical protein
MPALGGETESGVSAEMAESMARAANPIEHHEHLADLVGEWAWTSKIWMQPDAPAMETKGTASNVMLMGGRFLRTEFHGDFLGQPFMGIGFEGYDNMQKRHVGVWFDSAGTMMLNFLGDCSEGGKVLTSSADFLDPMTGNKTTFKGKTTVVNADEYRFESWNSDPSGEFHKSMEITYKRKS